jgi:hypothetical protein
LICPPALENAAARPLQRFVEIHNESQKNAGTSPGAQGLRTDPADWDRVIAWTHRSHLNKGGPVVGVDSNINDPIFADRAAQVFLELCGQ